jgi:DNA-binding response OmpR family regulator
VRRKILVVDDDPELVELLSFNLQTAGYTVGRAANGEEGLKKAKANVPDLIVLDLMMPEMDGFEVCEILRRNPATSATPIIMLTAVSSELSRFAGLGSGASDYVTKPFGIKQLICRIEELLRQNAATVASHTH